MDVALNGQWSGMASFSLIIYSRYFDKSVYCLNFTLQWSPVSKSTILERNVWVLFITYLVTMDVALSGQWSGMPSFSLIIYSYF